MYIAGGLTSISSQTQDELEYQLFQA